MNEQVTEHRGWSMSSEPVKRHYLDDPYWDFVEDGADTWSEFWIWLVISVVIIAGAVAYWIWG